MTGATKYTYVCGDSSMGRGLRENMLRHGKENAKETVLCRTRTCTTYSYKASQHWYGIGYLLIYTLHMPENTYQGIYIYIYMVGFSLDSAKFCVARVTKHKMMHSSIRVTNVTKNNRTTYVCGDPSMGQEGTVQVNAKTCTGNEVGYSMGNANMMSGLCKKTA